MKPYCHRPVTRSLSDLSTYVVRARHQFGPDCHSESPIRLFLDDARNPPLNEKGWVVVRTVKDGVDFLDHHGYLVTEISLDNDLGPDPQGYRLLEEILKEHQMDPFPLLKKIVIHTGNLPKWRLMREMARGCGPEVIRRVPHDRLYPHASEDVRPVTPYRWRSMNG